MNENKFEEILFGMGNRTTKMLVRAFSGWKSYVYLLVMVVSVTACEEIFDEDLSNKKLEILAPSNNLTTTKTTLTFWWNEMKDADIYQLQVVRTHFDSISSIAADTSLAGNKFALTLNPGRYQWRVWAENTGTNSDTVTYNLTIEDTPDLSEQEVVLNNPDDNAVFGVQNVTFSWYELPNATDYVVVFKETNWEGDNVFNPVYLSETEVEKTFDEGKYAWGVRALNSTSQSLVKVRTFYVDQTAPQAPSLNAPANESEVNESPVQLAWEHDTNDLTALHDSIYVATDADFESIVVSERITNQVYEFSPEADGEFFWRVKSIDQAGNRGAFSQVYKFTFTQQN